MKQRTIRCGVFGGLENDLSVISELHREPQVQLTFIYERKEGAVGLEIAEILGIDRCRHAGELPPADAVDCLVVSEPRARFSEELRGYIDGGTRILTPTEALKTLCGLEDERTTTPATIAEPYTVEDTLQSLERLFDRQALLKFLLEVAVKATDSTAGSIMLYSEEAAELYIAHAVGLSERVIKNTRQKLGDGISGWVAQTREAQLLQKPAGHALYARDRDRMEITSAISVPLVWKEKLLGVLNVSTGQGGREHNHADLSRLKVTSRRISRVLSESLKLQEAQMRHHSSKFRDTTREVANKDIGTSEKLTILSRYLAELIGADTLDIYLATAEGDWFVLAGSNRVLSPSNERIRDQRGALNRSFNEQRCIVLTEGGDDEEETLLPSLSVVYCPMVAGGVGGVVSVEFSDRYKLDEFLLIQDELIAEVGRFVSAEMRERELRRKVDAFSRVSDGAAALLAAHSIDELCDVVGRIVANVLECERVSVRLKRSALSDELQVSHILPPDIEHDEIWLQEDEERYKRLTKRGEPFTIAFLDFESAIRTGAGGNHTLLAFPIATPDTFFGGIVAYNKRPNDPVEEAIFTDLDFAILEHLHRILRPALDTVYSLTPAKAERDTGTYEGVLEENLERFRTVCANEIARSDRYHHGFALILFSVPQIEKTFEEDPKKAYRLIDEVTQGIRTRTRKTDYGAWIDHSSYVMLSLEGSKRVRFLISRAMTYLTKDLAEIGAESQDIRVGTALYPGKSRSPHDLLDEARASLKPYRRG